MDPAADLGDDALEVARELADHVAARNPDRQVDLLTLRVRTVDPYRDLEQVGVGVVRMNRVVNGFHRC